MRIALPPIKDELLRLTGSQTTHLARPRFLQSTGKLREYNNNPSLCQTNDRRGLTVLGEGATYNQYAAEAARENKMATYKKGDRVLVHNVRRGSFIARLTEDHTDGDRTVSCVLDQDDMVEGMRTEWGRGDDITCVNGLGRVVRLTNEKDPK